MGKPKAAAQRTGTGLVDLRDSAGSAASSATDALSEAPDRIKDAAGGNPPAPGAVAFGLGVLIGSLAPPTQEEQHLAEEVVPQLQDAATSAGKELASAVKDQAQQGMDQAKETATNAVQEVKEHATEAASTVTDKA